MEDIDYAQCLSKLHMTSIQRRHERYKLLYTYKLKEGLVPNISKTNGLEFTSHIRLWCKCTFWTYPLGPKAIWARDDSFALTACRLWNSLPKHIGDISGEDVPHLKRKLDRFLHYYPGIPWCGNAGHAYNIQGRKLNSLCNHYQNLRLRQTGCR